MPPISSDDDHGHKLVGDLFSVVFLPRVKQQLGEDALLFHKYTYSDLSSTLLLLFQRTVGFFVVCVYSEWRTRTIEGRSMS